VQKSVDALLLGVSDETARIYDSYLATWRLSIVRHTESSELQLAHQLLAIYQILAAAERDDIYRSLASHHF
jgi:hypothetical protein